MLKRLFDIVFSLIGLTIALPFIIIIALLIKRDSKGPVFYLAKRSGKNEKVFKMFKFRSMVLNADKIGGPSTSGDDPRLTKIGKTIRKYQLDELPQFINILLGHMSFVGPRPEVPSEIQTYEPEIKKTILSVRPGLTDLATLQNLHEEEILRGSKDPHETYREKIKPEKIRLGLEYIKNRSFLFDIKIIIKTLLSAFK